jgi:endonuclease/exonuclease/phosphatase family metal-dependent hydrolase
VTGKLLTHQLAPHYAALQKIKTRRALLKSPLWGEIGAEIERVCGAVEVGHHPHVKPKAGLRVAAWNVQRGSDLDGVSGVLSHLDADLILLVEVDNGMGRSGDRNVARLLAESLGMSYAFGVSYLVLEDDFGENPQRLPNGLALAGTAILSRLPIRRAVNVDLPELRDKFSSSEKRLGRKRALFVELEGAPFTVAVAHLDSNAGPRGRARQLAALLDSLNGPALVGGDFNSTTYDAASALSLARDLLHKLFVTGFRRTVENYLTPELLYDTPLFTELARRGFVLDGFNDRARGTMSYDLAHPYAIEKTREKVGRLLTWWLQRRLRPWNGVVPARLDWFAGREVTPRNPSVADGGSASDHSPIVVELV